MAIRRISSSATLLVSLMIPVLWASFFGCLFIAILFVGGEMSPLLMSWWVRGLYGLLLLLFGLLIVKTLMKLKRVEVDEHFVYVYNYFKSARYPYHNVEYLADMDLGLIKLGKLRLVEAGRFGKNMYFLRSKKNILKAKEEFALFEEKATTLAITT